MNFTELPVLSEVSLLDLNYKKRAHVSILGRNFSSLSFRISGKVRIVGEGADFLSGSESITFIPKGYPYGTEVFEGGRMLVMHFVTENSCGGTPMTAKVPYPKVLYNLFENASNRFASRGCDLALMSMAYQLLSETNYIFSPTVNIPLWLKNGKKEIDEKINDSALRVRDLASQCGISEVYFRREFARCYGSSPLEYIKKRRIETAKSLLQTGLYTITEVAFRSGFESSSYFSSEFRRLVGITPREYVKNGSF